mmetsp:Transcript_17059/g.28807  ORF Transcript_17059/g.28807 Transcript_17059/m.28807 type:complete len:91 (+) Transcript_17059:272-544(+)
MRRLLNFNQTVSVPTEESRGSGGLLGQLPELRGREFEMTQQIISELSKEQNSENGFQCLSQMQDQVIRELLELMHLTLESASKSQPEERA